MSELDMLEEKLKYHEEEIMRIKERIYELKNLQLITCPKEKGTIDIHEVENKRRQKEKERIIDNLAYLLSSDKYDWQI